LVERELPKLEVAGSRPVRRLRVARPLMALNLQLSGIEARCDGDVRV
jgi:hypothetical protein